MHPATPAATAALPHALRTRRTLPITLGSLIRYVESPVGPYSEVFAMPRLFPALGLRGHVPFIAVDSVPSVHCGRAHWALPKVLAGFSGLPQRRYDRIEATGDGWWLGARLTARGPTLPFWLPSSGVQIGPTGEIVDFGGGFRGRTQPVRVRVDVDPGSSLHAWLRPGRHFGLVFSGRLTLGPAH